MKSILNIDVNLITDGSQETIIVKVRLFKWTIATKKAIYLKCIVG